jgi:hypothetical protein
VLASTNEEIAPTAPHRTSGDATVTSKANNLPVHRPRSSAEIERDAKGGNEIRGGKRNLLLDIDLLKTSPRRGAPRAADVRRGA